MIVVLLVLVGLGAPAEDHQQLLVMAGENVATCRPAPAEWASDKPFKIAPPELVREDLARYFAGLDLMFTPILGAAWKGVVRFCTETDESVVLEALARLVVKSRPAQPPPESGLILGAAGFLEALASPLLIDKLNAIMPDDDAEATRRRLALDLVRKTLEARSVAP